MNTHRRRCHSEHVPFPVQRAIPPHKAAKIRQAQLRETQPQPFSKPKSSKIIRIETSHKDEKEVVPQSRHSSTPVPPLQQNYHTEDPHFRALPSHSQHKDLRQGLQQERISSQFPSIETVIAQPKGCDTRRKLGETEFYEHTGEDSIVRRRSMMRTVDKDDLLVARGANPRTGLITPDWNSVASSLDNDHVHSARRDRPSAQWKLDGDAWVSVPPEDHSMDISTRLGSGIYRPASFTDHVNTVHSQRKVSEPRQTTALTEQNLRTFSDQHEPDPIMHQTLPRENKVTQDNQIKRKPVKSTGPGLGPNLNFMKGRAARNVSSDTVIQSPGAPTRFVPEQLTGFQYYSPDSVGKELTQMDATMVPQRSQVDGSFLDLPVESRRAMTMPPRGFAGKTASRDQLQQSLRTSSGPYPSHPSSQPLHTIRDPYGLHQQRIDPHRGRRGPPQPAQKVYHPDSIASFQLTQSRIRLQDYPESRSQTRKVLPPQRGRPIPILEEDRQAPNSKNNLHTQPILGAAHMAINKHHPTSETVLVKDIRSQEQDHTLPKHDTYSHRDQMLAGGMQTTPDSAADHTVTHLNLPKDVDVELMSDRRPRLGSRAQQVLHIPKVRIGRTGTAPKVQSNTIGTNVALVDEGDEDGVPEGLSEDPEPEPDLQGTNSTPQNRSSTENLLVLPKTNIRNSSQIRGQDNVRIKDHSVCCPECCTKFDCHEGCLGHPSPNAGVADSETSSLLSMGIFDATFETSVKAVNMALLTPSDESNSRLAKIRTVFGLKAASGTPNRSPTKPSNMKRTLRDELLSQKVNIGLIRHPQPGPQDIDITQAKAAAIKAQNMAGGSPRTSISSGTAQIEVKSKNQTKTKTKADKNTKVNVSSEANGGRRVSNQGRKVSKHEVSRPDMEPADSSETTLSQPERKDASTIQQATDDCEQNRSDPETMSMLSRVNTFIRDKSYLPRSRRIDFSVLNDPLILDHLHSLITVFKDMTLTVADTTSIVVEVALEYNKSGTVVLPAGISASEVAGNLLKSALYLMIAACVYSLCVKIGRTVLAALRIVLLPVRICAWIIG